MAETKQILALVVLTFFIGTTGLFLISYVPSLIEGDVVVDQYNAVLYPNGTLVETYVYNVKVSGEYRMLYRTWEAPLTVGNSNLNYPHVEFLNATRLENTIAYAKDYSSSVWVGLQYNRSTASIISTIRSLAEDNEVGIYKPDRFPAGIYTVQYAFNLQPPVEYDSTYAHLNLKFASQHLKYRNATIVIEGASNVVAIYPHPPSMNVANRGDSIVISGASPENSLLEVEMLLKKDALALMDGFPKQYSDVRALTEQANSAYNAQYYAGVAINTLAKAMLLVTPFLFLLIYLAYGRERTFGVPEFLSTVPNNKRKPWFVNLVYKGDTVDFDQNGYYATILDLHRKGKLKMTSKDSGLRIQVLTTQGDDDYETEVLHFLNGLSANGVVDTDMIRTRVDSYTDHRRASSLMSLKEELHHLTGYRSSRISSQYASNGRKRVAPVILIGVVLLIASIALGAALPNVESFLIESAVASFIVIIQCVIALAFPSTLFGRWKGEEYKEKLEWDAFKRMLSDLAAIKKYAPQDLSMWGEWLVYGTALGVGDNVVKAMKDLDIKLEEVRFAPYIPFMFRPIVVAHMASAGGGGRGGGLGGGGGFGGGGGGAR